MFAAEVAIPSASIWSVVITAVVTILIAVIVRRYSIKRTSDNKDRESLSSDRETLSSDEKNFRQELLNQVLTQSSRISTLEEQHGTLIARIGHLEADLAKTKGERDLAFQKAALAEQRAVESDLERRAMADEYRKEKEASNTRERQLNERISVLEAEVAFLQAKVIRNNPE